MENILKEKLKKTLFHGTLMNRAAKIMIDGIDFSKLNDRADFGKGFYLTDSYALAKTTALTRYNQEIQSKGSSYPPVVIRVKIKCNNIINYNIKEFYGEDITWKRFICCNRWYNKIISNNSNCDNNYDLKYDIVIGLTADGKINKLETLIKKNNYNLSNEFICQIKPFITSYYKLIGTKSKKYETKAYQISIHNSKFISDCIRYNSYDIILVKEDKYNE